MELNEENLFSSFKANYENVEKIALDLLANRDICLYNTSTQFTTNDCYKALCKLKSFFGTTVNLERCLCLIILTDYAICGITNSLLYSSVGVKYSTKFLTTFFNKLHKEWRTLFKPNDDFLTTERLTHILNLLRYFVSKLSSLECAKIMENTLKICETLYERYNSSTQFNKTDDLMNVACKTAIETHFQRFVNNEDELNNNAPRKHAMNDILDHSHKLYENDHQLPNDIDVLKSPLSQVEENIPPKKKCLDNLTEKTNKTCLLKSSNNAENNTVLQSIQKFKKCSDIKCYTVPLSKLDANTIYNPDSRCKPCSIESENKPIEVNNHSKKKLNAFDILMRKSLPKKTI